MKKKSLGLPWWPSGEESACQFRGHFEPCSGKISLAMEQLSLCATEPVLCNKRTIAMRSPREAPQ